MWQKPFTVLFGGQAGYGIMSAGAMIAKAAGRNGLWAFVVNEYPSLIKGGLNTCSVTLDSQPLQAYEERLDFLCVLSQQALDQNYAKLDREAAILYDSDAVKPDTAKIPAGVSLYPVKLIGSLTGETAKVMANSAMVGAFCALAGFPVDLIADLMKSGFIKAKVLQPNLDLLRQSYEQTRSQYSEHKAFPLLFKPNEQKKMLLNGNDAIAMGAIKAGVKFAAGYPMTPGSSVLTYLADHAAQYGLIFKQAEDEIAAINMLIGAGFAGVRAIGSTSGGGFALMTEALGFAAQGEVPLVMVNAQRGGPSTGLPTRTAQADLNFVVHASQGEFPRIVVAPGDVEECFVETYRLFNLVEKYQVPGIILTDKYLADSSITHPYFEEQGLSIERGKLVDEAWLQENQPYLRYRITDDGVSPRAIPGQKGGRHIVTSYTHGEDGFYSSGNQEYAEEEPQITAAGLDKLFNKVPAILNDIPGVKLHGPQEADLTIIAWGSSKGAILEALAAVKQEGYRVNFLQVLYPCPFPADAVQEILAKSKKTLLIEGNKTAQLGGMIRAYTGFASDKIYLKYDSRPFVPSLIIDKIKEVLD
ncbi:2-oxoacid:acceptor oxidoreductase subunit alpha|uniref:2-oxoglutarate ferredoxin oxidoreductase subunit alpha n=1 Tax=Dendrosporobacter quercicolus TaxID=146817 RepID=A0A1G9W8J0_9FIRM|nr:2-oxoacid:acceptor oxidoreductase subunit alpha [Dendrosporobacter quercicolus]NSL47685.1 2-oxoacid:acceptor oxidoreductase subunit alpha [Dendrosporobacter quercicolus DSM 1736]SDM80874.1 2-oxoglutarate ferredoxin oxidoreductase subunit alpha [Dendrosporobacter quercicolus]